MSTVEVSLPSSDLSDIEIEADSDRSIISPHTEHSSNLPSTWPDSTGTMSAGIENQIAVDATQEGASRRFQARVSDAGEDEDEEIMIPDSGYSKRKRASVNYNIGKNYNDIFDERSYEHTPKRTKLSRSLKKVRGVIIGVWSESSEPEDEDKHAVYGFLDSEDRLRTRYHALNRRGEELIGNMPAGQGKCWVTFDRIIFDQHLHTLNAVAIKEYVKIRGAEKPEATAELRHEGDIKAAKAAYEAGRLIDLEGMKTPGQPVGVERPPPRFSKFKGANGVDNQSPSKTSSMTAVAAKDRGVLLGYWADSSERRLEDKHAVFGVVNAGDNFRVKVQKVTRDGRTVEGNFPSGAGSFWLQYNKLVIEPWLSSLSKDEIKEYVRIRQQQLANGEMEEDTKQNEITAIRKAKAKAHASPADVDTSDLTEAEEVESSPSELEASPRPTRQKRASRKRTEADTAHTRSPKEKTTRKTTYSIPRDNDGARTEAADAFHKNTAKAFNKNISKLQKAWTNQTAAQPPQVNGTSNGEGSQKQGDIVLRGMVFEKKEEGAFEGKLVSQPSIVTVDGEHYVKYEVWHKIPM